MGSKRQKNYSQDARRNGCLDVTGFVTKFPHRTQFKTGEQYQVYNKQIPFRAHIKHKAFLLNFPLTFQASLGQPLRHATLESFSPGQCCRVVLNKNVCLASANQKPAIKRKNKTRSNWRWILLPHKNSNKTKSFTT